MIRVFFAALLGAGLLTVAVSSCTMMPGQREICANNIDDDMNGLVDCADPDCKGKSECFVDAGFFGTCAKCGQGCSRQEQCLQTSFTNDQPLPLCLGARCTSLSKAISVNLTLNAAAYMGLSPAPRSIVTRFISKTAIDGSEVTCSTIEAAAPGRTQAAVRQLEDTGRFQYLGFDSRTVMGTPGQDVRINFIPVQTGSQFLIWFEYWYGPIDGVTRFPTQNRAGFECFDGPAIGQSWPPLTPVDDCPAPGQDAGGTMCRSFTLTATRGPQ
ncbi:MAG: hypothetical protein MUC96_27230 [Myxococcaceae bacterium]|jgi:hypothetical protein|nr:hypothetical protein [Myxococcaceae bacterium]